MTAYDVRFDMLRQHLGGLPQFEEWGGGTILYIVGNACDTLCADCATIILIDPEAEEYRDCNPLLYGAFDEGESEVCRECGKVIESSYGDPDADKEVVES
jgi:hypothetical protein